MSVFDGTTIFQELDMLELRMRILWDFVDAFVVVEGKYTQSGNEKPLYLSENIKRFAWAKEKLFVVIDEQKYKKEIDGMDLPNKLLAKTLENMAGENDVLMMSNIDEIPSRAFMESINSIKSTVTLEMSLFFYNIKNGKDKKWKGTVASRKSYGDLWHAFKNRGSGTCLSENGWHFSYFLTKEQIREKLKAFGHASSYNKEPYINEDYIEGQMKKGDHVLGKNKGYKTKQIVLPNYLIDEVKRFPVFVGEQ